MILAFRLMRRFIVPHFIFNIDYQRAPVSYTAKLVFFIIPEYSVALNRLAIEESAEWVGLHTCEMQ